MQKMEFVCYPNYSGLTNKPIAHSQEMVIDNLALLWYSRILPMDSLLDPLLDPLVT